MIPSTNQAITAFRNLLAAAPAHWATAGKVCPVPNLEPGTWNSELGTWNSEPGTRNLELGTVY